jgi:hypothetical protein
MADDSGNSYVLGRLVLDYMKAFMWPLVAIVVVVIYQDDVRQILSERQVDIFGLRIGDRVEQIETQAMAEIEDLRQLLDAQKAAAETTAEGTAPDTQLTQDIETKLSSLERNISREIAQVQDTRQTVQAAPPGERTATVEAVSSRTERAAAAERRGFEALLGRDVAAAIAAFDAARGIWPDYHNVAERGRVLRKRHDDLADPASPEWPLLYREILARYSWGMPDDLRSALRGEVAKAY